MPAGAGRNLERAERMDASTGEGTRSKIIRDGVWLGQLWRAYAAGGRSRRHGVKPSRETIFIRFGLRLLEACWRICSQTTKQTEEKEMHVNGSKCLLMAWFGFFFFFLMKCVDFAFAVHQG